MKSTVSTTTQMTLDSKLVLLPAEQLIEALTEMIRNEIRASKHEDSFEKMLSPAEACKLFTPSVSIGTLENWTSQGRLTKHRIGRRTYYKYGELMNGMKQVKKFERRLAA